MADFVLIRGVATMRVRFIPFLWLAFGGRVMVYSSGCVGVSETSCFFHSSLLVDMSGGSRKIALLCLLGGFLVDSIVFFRFLLGCNGLL